MVKLVRFLTTFITALLVLSYLSGVISPTVRTAEAQVDENKGGRNWIAVDYDRMATQFNPQTEINKQTVQLLELKWIFSFPQAVDIGGYSYSTAVGAVATPLVVDGIIYVASDLGKVFALEVSTGKTLWTYTAELNRTRDIARGIVLGAGQGAAPGHIHGISYAEGKLYIPSAPCDVVVVDALTGKRIARISDMCVNVPGNEQIPFAEQQKRGFNVACSGNYKGHQSYGPTVLGKERVLVVPAGATDENNRGARGFFAGYDMDNYNLLWRFFLKPPAGGDPEWVTRIADKGWIQGVKASTIPREFLLNDWGDARCVQTGPGWGQYAYDEETGIVYVGTTQPAPDRNATFRQGPNVFSDSIIAIKAKTGELVWWYQTMAHDIYDWDCAWNTVFAKIDFGSPRGVKKAVFKGCKNGIVYMLDAATGETIWTFNAPTIARAPHTPTFSQQSQSDYKQLPNTAPGSKLNCPADGHNMAAWDPKDGCIYKLRWWNEPSKDPSWINPNVGNGAIEADVAFDGKTVYVGTYNAWTYRAVAPVDPWLPASSGAITPASPEQRPTNSTVYALDAATGKVKWSYFIDGVGFRAGNTVSGGVVYTSTTDGILRALDADTGKLLSQKSIGGGLTVPPVIAADTKGKMMLFQLFGRAFASIGTNVPGGVIAMGLPDKVPEPQVVTKEVIKEVTKEVVKEVPKQVTVEVISPVSYALVGVAVVVLVASTVLISRRKKA